MSESLILAKYAAEASYNDIDNQTVEMTKRSLLDAFALTLCQVTCSAELRYSPHSDIRAVRDAFAAKGAVLSVLLAQKGIKGFERPFEGEAGLFNLYSKGNYDRSMLTRDIGRTYEGANISFKPWPTCRGTHTYIEAAFGLLDAHSFDINQISEIRIVVSTFNKMLCEPLKAKRQPATAIDGKFSLPFVIATAIIHKEVTLNRFTPKALIDENVLQLAKKVTYEVDPDLSLREATKGFLEIRMQDNKVMSKVVTHAYGHPENPISDEDLLGKFMDCAESAAVQIPQKNLVDISKKILSLEDIDNVTEIIKKI